jgi:dipeptidyl aminopeptidase/acylaminoacyl peptidase
VLRRWPDDLELHDTTADGRVLVAHSLSHLGLVAKGPGEKNEHDLSWTGMSFVTDISADGERILFLEQRQMDYEVWLRRTDGSAPTHLGPGLSFSLSPDGEWALASRPSLDAPLVLLPTGAGTERELPGKTGVLWATWTPDGQRVVFAAADPEGEARLYVQGVDGSEPRAISDEWIQAGAERPFRASPDGRWIAALGPDSVIKLYPVEGGEPRELPGVLPGDEPTAWAKDSRGVFVSRFASLPAQIFRVDLESGERSLWLELMPRDPAGIGGVYSFVLTPDGEGYAYTYMRRLDTLYLMTGLE